MATPQGDGSIVLNTKVDTSGIKKAMSTIGGISQTAGKAFAAVGAAAATATVAITKMAVSAYADYEQLVGGVETLFKDSAGKVIAYAENAFATAGVSANEYMKTVTSFSASLLQSLGGDTEAAADIANQALIDMSDNANKMGTSMEMIQNAYQGFAKQNYTMLDNLKLGYGGTKTEMERLLKDAQALTGVKYDISNLADVYNAIHAIQENLGIAGTTALEAEKTISGSAAAMKASWQNVLTAIAGGGDLDKAINNLVYSISKYFENIVPVIERALSGIGTLIERVAPMLVQTIAKSLIKSIPSLLNAVYQMILGLAKGIYDGIAALFSGDGVKAIEKQTNKIQQSVKNQDALTDAVEETAEAQEKTLAGFDELNILSANAASNQDDVSSQISVPTTVNATMSVEEVNSNTILSGVNKLIDEIKEAWSQADFTSVGLILGEKIRNSLDSINWSMIQPVANKFSKAVATFFNGAITPDTFASIGTSVSNGLNTALYSGLTFLSTFDFYNFGSAIAIGLTQAIQTIDWASVGNLFSTGLSSLLDFAAGFVANFDVSTIFDAIFQFLSGIDWQQIANSVGTFLQSVDWGTVLETLIIIGIGALIKTKITTLFTTVIQPALETQLTNLTTFIQGLNVGGLLLGALGLGVLIEGLQNMFEEGPNWENILMVVAGAIMLVVGAVWAFNSALLANPITWVVVGIMALIGAIALIVVYWDEVKAALSTAAKWFNDKVIKPIADFFKWLWGKIIDGLNGLIGGVESGINGVIWLFESLINLVVKGLNKFIGGLSKVTGAIGDLIGLDLRIPKIPEANLGRVKLPRLAQGAVIPANREFLAVLGDQKHGRNLEAPEDLIRQIVREETQGPINLTVKATGGMAQLIRLLSLEITKEQNRVSVF